MYNTTLHGTTRKTPNELLFGRTIRDKIQSVTDLSVGGGDKVAKDNDIWNKTKDKERKDRILGAKEIETKEGDKALIKIVNPPYKLDPLSKKQFWGDRKMKHC